MGGPGRGLIAAAWLFAACADAPDPAPAPTVAPATAGWLDAHTLALNGQPPHLHLEADAIWVAHPWGADERRVGSEEVRPAVKPPPPRTRSGEAVAATISGVPLLVFTSTGEPRRVAIPRLPKARRVRVLGVTDDDRIWLLLSAELSGRARDLALVDGQGRILERARAPEPPPATGTAAPGKGSEPAWAVAGDGRLAVAYADGDRVKVVVYTPGLGADLLASP